MSETASAAVPDPRSPAGSETSMMDSLGLGLKQPALSLDLRIGRVEIFHTLSIDLAELVQDRHRDRRILHRLRATDRFFEPLRKALHEDVLNCVDEGERYIRPRMRESVRLGGKAVWTDQFLERFAPIRLPTPENLTHNQSEIARDKRISDNPKSPLHYVRFKGAEMKMFRDGTITYTVRTTFDDNVSGNRNSEVNPPASISDSINRLDAVDGLLAENFRSALAGLMALASFRAVIRQHIRLADKLDDSKFDSIDLVDPAEIQAPDLKRRCKEHRTIFVENFYNGPQAEGLSRAGTNNFADARVELRTVLQTASLAGLLNTASWYDHYNARYVSSLGQREIGYRDDEIYLTDRKATVVSATGFWEDGIPADPLTRYKWDIVLAIEYNMARLAYLASSLVYYQTHTDVQGLEKIDPLDALAHVIDGRSILSHIDESLDLSLLVDHGFTRLFIRRLRQELAIDEAIGFIRGRVADASTSVGLKSAVLSAENTSKESLRATLASVEAARENNALQRTLKRWAIVAVVVAVVLSVASSIVSAALTGDPDILVCVVPNAQSVSPETCRTSP